MTELILNIDLQVRQIFLLAKTAALLDSVEEVYSTTPLTFDLDDSHFFWQTIEDKFDVAITRAQKQSLRNVGELVHYLKVRLAA